MNRKPQATISMMLGDMGISKTLHASIAASMGGGELSDAAFQELFEYYSKKNIIPYGVAKARDGDPYVWISSQLEQDFAAYKPSRPDGTGRQQCTICDRRSVAGLRSGSGKCPYHWAVGQWGQEWADRCYPKKEG